MRQLAYKALKVCSKAERASLEEGVEPPDLLDRIMVPPRPAAVEANDEPPPAHQTTPSGKVVLRKRAILDDSSQKEVAWQRSAGGLLGCQQ